MYALIQAGKVVNIIEASAEFAAAIEGFDAVIHVAMGEARIGDDYIGGNFFSPAPPVQAEPDPEPEDHRIWKSSFYERMTPDVMAAIEIAALDVPTAPMEQRKLAARIRADLRTIYDSRFVDLARADLRNGLLGLEAAGVIPAGHAAVVLDSPIQPHEEWQP